MVGVSEKPGRYQRSSNGPIGAMIVTLLAIGAFVLVRSLVPRRRRGRTRACRLCRGGNSRAGGGVRRDRAVLAALRLDRDRDRPVPDRSAALGLSILTDDELFVGLRQEDESVDDLVEENIDEDAESGDPVSLDSVVGSEWQTWTDEGGDTAIRSSTATRRCSSTGLRPPPSCRSSSACWSADARDGSPAAQTLAGGRGCRPA